MNPRQRMRQSNRYATEYLLQHGATDVWLKRHTRFHDIHYTPGGKYVALDLFNLWDGICIRDKLICFIQIKTNRWASEQPILKWAKTVSGCMISVINVRKKGSRWLVFERTYQVNEIV